MGRGAPRRSRGAGADDRPSKGARGGGKPRLLHQRPGDSSRRAYEESLAIYRELGDRRGEAEGEYNLAFAHLLAHEFGPARELLEEAIHIQGDLGDVVRQAHAKAALGLISLQEGDLDAGAALTEAALRTFMDAGDEWGVTWTSGQLAAVALRRGDYERSRSLMLQSLDRSEVMGASGWNAVAVEGMAETPRR